MQENGSVQRTNTVVYARVSSKEQEREGFSIPAQLGLLRDFARQQSMVVLEEFIDVESASTSGRTGFGQMLAFLKKNNSRCAETFWSRRRTGCIANISDYSKLWKIPASRFISLKEAGHALARFPLQRSVHARHPRPDGPELFSESWRGDSQGYVAEGQKRPLPQLRTGGVLPQC